MSRRHYDFGQSSVGSPTTAAFTAASPRDLLPLIGSPRSPRMASTPVWLTGATDHSGALQREKAQRLTALRIEEEQKQLQRIQEARAAQQQELCREKADENRKFMEWLQDVELEKAERKAKAAELRKELEEELERSIKQRETRRTAVRQSEEQEIHLEAQRELEDILAQRQALRERLLQEQQLREKEMKLRDEQRHSERATEARLDWGHTSKVQKESTIREDQLSARKHRLAAEALSVNKRLAEERVENQRREKVSERELENTLLAQNHVPFMRNHPSPRKEYIDHEGKLVFSHASTNRQRKNV
eukprot:TRINITY_DN429_c0_g2_i1.p1 TRINITY_DN429_c0_g2~~TRINITY_DN429_c0_g2_i1.p1  ORF type:complete len:312 (-),score=73.51 TRINITY_DN429_c0_g2_i1:141-1052(-)